ncbi:hypothetical protein [Xanthomonas hortorum]|uniref:Uncharacterized protein n=1 Tax=Xanthomonas hortorum pv. pelargonii TaxID=453602 RepID=A0A6V7EPR8_9XANT|nr:hypothetical protein [Xanthomonas hortorum]MCE4352441.1 hypothetical protein [Xanthomonas hortorum pv. pelargonii]MCM5525644.1 hypothetical protein [Xanthomonas hortorum pv. pelargonii]MCM5535792.1 hypothetical protein [Xanthomonas hortorum pv. pelargonii]MCM5539934.1 hypothetical protein [Xanthomonas hortorum pv. pelargonii]MCM5546533.1 hypothetical protein [Xanthomonas hortorum pv. pelargonii]
MITRILQLSARVASNAWVEVGVGADADILIADRGGKREERATFGRRAPGQQRSIHMQEPSWLGGVDLAIWETQRCAIPLCGFVCTASADGSTAATWLSQDNGEVYAAGLRNVMDIGGRLQMGFSLLVASSASMPTHRPLCIDGDVKQWLQLGGKVAMLHLTPWQLNRYTTAAGVRPDWTSEEHSAQIARV